MWCSKATNEWLVLREYAGGAEGKGLGSAYSGRGGEQQVGALETKYKSSRAYTRQATDPCASRGAVSLGPPISGGRLWIRRQINDQC
jgi:hypothetical protein